MDEQLQHLFFCACKPSAVKAVCVLPCQSQCSAPRRHINQQLQDQANLLPFGLLAHTSPLLLAVCAAGQHLATLRLSCKPPRPPELPGLMHSISMTAYLATKGDLERLLLEWRQQHGPFFEFQVPGSPPVMVVSDPDAIREVRRGSGLSWCWIAQALQQSHG
jgi:hypothetical protein